MTHIKTKKYHKEISIEVDPIKDLPVFMNKKGDIFVKGFILLIILMLLITFFMIIGLHIITTSNGKHVGYVTSVETNGIIFKTHSVYFKSELESSQEDRYCIIDLNLKKDLSKAAEGRKRVTIYYYSWLAPGWNYCKGEDIAIINNWEYSPGE